MSQTIATWTLGSKATLLPIGLLTCAKSGYLRGQSSCFFRQDQGLGK